MKKLVLILTVALALIAGPLAAENEIIDVYVNPNSYQLTAEIDRNGDTLVRFEGEVSYLFGYMFTTMIQRHSPEYIEMNSFGGVFDEIQQPGNWIGKNDIEVRIAPGDVCVSACAYLALYSSNITIEGQIGFHLPYYEAYPKDITLGNVARESFDIAIGQMRMFFEYDWAMFLYYTIYKATDTPDTFVVFADTDSLNEFRIDSKEEYTSHIVDDPKYSIISSFEINNIAILQQGK